MAVRDAERRIEEVKAHLRGRATRVSPNTVPASAIVLNPDNLLRRRDLEPFLATWSIVGGCGVGASSGAAGGGIQWVGRGVTGGLLSIETIGAHSDIGRIPPIR